MDIDRFDLLTRSLTAQSRRRFSRALAGLVLVGGLEARFGHGAAEAKKKRRKKKKKCGSGTKKCGKRCIPEGACCADAECDPETTGQICVDGDCVCGSRRGVSTQAC